MDLLQQMGLGERLHHYPMQLYLPHLLRDFLPVTMPFAIAWPGVLRGLCMSVGLVVLFTLLPILAVRRMTPLLALRAVYTARQPDRLWQP
jgi:putative ABC transport system permease protein